jgi:glyoxylase I family protein
MPALTGHHHVALTVSDLDRSAQWYTRVLDMEEQFREDSPTRKAAVYRFRGGSWSVGLVQHGEPGKAGFDPTVIGLDHLAFTVDTPESLRQWAKHLDGQGVEHSGPIDVPPGEILNFKDPDGIALALFWDRGKAV